MECPDFLSAFQKARGLQAEREMTKLDYQSALDLTVPSGRIMACDPYSCGDEKPFNQPIPPGRYPVTLCIASFHNSDQRVALAALHISETLPVRWEIATRPGEERTTSHGYCVDSAIGCFMDAEAVGWVAETTEGNPELFEERMSYVPTWGWVNMASDSSDAANVVAFSSGWGDGGYPSFFGYDATDQPVCLITDFGVLEEA
jgi:hypothetical protein